MLVPKQGPSRRRRLKRPFAASLLLLGGGCPPARPCGRGHVLGLEFPSCLAHPSQPSASPRGSEGGGGSRVQRPAGFGRWRALGRFHFLCWDRAMGRDILEM